MARPGFFKKENSEVFKEGDPVENVLSMVTGGNIIESGYEIVSYKVVQSAV